MMPKTLQLTTIASALLIHPSQSLAFITHLQRWPPTRTRTYSSPTIQTRYFSHRRDTDCTNDDDSRPNRREPDLFDYFDPLLSPHQYPNGIDASKNIIQPQQKMASFTDSAYSTTNTNTQPDTRNTITARTTTNHEQQQPPFLFDPTLSPHHYPFGVDAGPRQHNFQDNLDHQHHRATIGILLIDHGSRRDSSNQQLQLIAQRYQSLLPNNYIVHAAHMEIASPSISEGIDFLARIPGITTILCHPYFLSPGRHVSDDVPDLIRQAVLTMSDQVEFMEQHSISDASMQELKPKPSQNKIQLYMTDSVGSDLDCMITVIDQMVQQTLLRVLQPLN